MNRRTTTVTADRLAPGDVVLMPDEQEGVAPAQALVMKAEPNGELHYVEFFIAHRGQFFQVAHRAKPGARLTLSHPPEL